MLSDPAGVVLTRAVGVSAGSHQGLLLPLRAGLAIVSDTLPGRGDETRGDGPQKWQENCPPRGLGRGRGSQEGSWVQARARLLVVCDLEK